MGRNNRKLCRCLRRVLSSLTMYQLVDHLWTLTSWNPESLHFLSVNGGRCTFTSMILAVVKKMLGSRLAWVIWRGSFFSSRWCQNTTFCRPRLALHYLYRLSCSFCLSRHCFIKQTPLPGCHGYFGVDVRRGSGWSCNRVLLQGTSVWVINIASDCSLNTQ